MNYHEVGIGIDPVQVELFGLEPDKAADRRSEYLVAAALGVDIDSDSDSVRPALPGI